MHACTQYYRAIYERNIAFLSGKGKSKVSLNNVAMQLRKACNHPYLIEGAEEEVIKQEGIATRGDPTQAARSEMKYASEGQAAIGTKSERVPTRAPQRHRARPA